MEFRIAREEDTPAVKKLWAYSFESHEPYFSWYFREIYRPERTLCCFEQGALAASLQLAPYRLKMRGQELDACYIVGVVTSPDHRGRGIGSALMGRALSELQKNGVPLALLLPACPAFYFPLGFAYCYEHNAWQIPLENLRPLARGGGAWREAEPENDIPALQAVYDAQNRGRNGFILRSETNWRNLLTEHKNEGGFCRLWLKDGAARGYLLYSLKDKVFRVTEMGCMDRETQGAAFAFALNHANEAARFDWRAAADDTTHLHLPQKSGVSRLPFVMGRLVDVQNAFERLSFPPELETAVTLRLRDSAAPWNEDAWLLRVREGRMRLEPFSGEADAVMDVAALSRLFFGSASVWQLEREDALKGRGAALEKLGALFPPCRNWLNEQG
ncbi:MAG: GNAT family N-acetyltransferase [Clostridiales bacterium]|nr:GNAT family N-acetyltransferase [Clostridiales bacterium]